MTSGFVHGCSLQNAAFFINEDNLVFPLKSNVKPYLFDFLKQKAEIDGVVTGAAQLSAPYSENIKLSFLSASSFMLISEL